MEIEWFTWKEQEEIGTGFFSFHGCTLTRQIGRHPPGTNIQTIHIDWTECAVDLWLADDKSERYLATLSIRQRLE